MHSLKIPHKNSTSEIIQDLLEWLVLNSRGSRGLYITDSSCSPFALSGYAVLRLCSFADRKPHHRIVGIDTHSQLCEGPTIRWRLQGNSLIVGRSPGEGIGYPLQYSWASLVAQLVKNPPRMRETWVGKIPWRRELATHSSILAWRIPWDRQELDTTERLLLSFLLMAKAKSEPLLLLKRKDKSVVVALIQLFYFHKLTLKTKFHIGTKT